MNPLTPNHSVRIHPKTEESQRLGLKKQVEGLFHPELLRFVVNCTDLCSLIVNPLAMGVDTAIGLTLIPVLVDSLLSVFVVFMKVDRVLRG